jgi:hypothetical protein
MEKENKNPISANTKYISKGTYGLTVRPALPNKKNNGSWEQFDNGVTKLFFVKRDRNNALDAVRQVVSLTGNDRQKAYPYRYNYKLHDLPNSLLNNLRKSGLTRKLQSDLYTMRMPDLGVDLEKINRPEHVKDLAKIPLTKMMEQIKKLLTQVSTFVKNKKIHGDIREPNIMIDTKTGDVTIIDFDFFKDATTFYRDEDKNFTKYQRPPENCLYSYVLQKGDYDKANKLLTDAKKESIDEFIRDLEDLDKDSKELQYYVEDINQYLFRKELGLTVKTSDAFVNFKNMYLAIFNDISVVNDEARELFENTMLSTFDGYGLASCLLDLLIVTYTKYAFDPKYSIEEAIPHMRVHLKKKVVKAAAAAGGAGAKAADGNVVYEDYTDSELEIIYKTVQCIFYIVLMPMLTFNVLDRQKPDTAIWHLDRIIMIHKMPEYLDKYYEIVKKTRKIVMDASIGKITAEAEEFVAAAAANAAAKAAPAKVVSEVPALPASRNKPSKSSASKSKKSKSSAAKSRKSKSKSSSKTRKSSKKSSSK